jgi:hypothetical protein
MIDRSRDALGYTQITSLAAAVGVGTIPAGSETLLLQCTTQNVRYRDDGVDPTGTVGMVLVALTIYEFTVAQIARMKFIETAASAVLNISFYGSKTA